MLDTNTVRRKIEGIKGGSNSCRRNMREGEENVPQNEADADVENQPGGASGLFLAELLLAWVR